MPVDAVEKAIERHYRRVELSSAQQESVRCQIKGKSRRS